MAEENEAVKPEKEPKYRRSAQLFGVAVAALLCLVLIFDTFSRRSREDEKEAQAVATDPPAARQSELDFQRRFEQERERRQLQVTAGKAQESAASMARLESRRDPPPGGAAQAPPDDRRSVEAEWRSQERRRALNARLSKFGMKKTSRNLKPKPVQYQAPSMPSGQDQSAVRQEQNRVRNEIKRLEQMPPGARSGGPALRFTQRQGEADGEEESLTVGRPRTEAEPQPGQKLIPTGTVISAVLDQELMSDYTGPFRALTTHDVYDVSGRYIIMPQGSRITGRSLRISNVNEPIQARMGLTVRWLVLPNGKRISFEKRVAALDRAGVPALKDQVNYHLIAQFLGVAAYALLSAETSRSGSGFENDSTFAGDMGASLRQQFAPLAAKYLNLVPTITLRVGTPLKIFIEDDIYADPWQTLRHRLLKAHRAAY